MSCTNNCQHAKKLNKGGLGNIEKTKKKDKAFTQQKLQA
jgi:hypothetical protein